MTNKKPDKLRILVNGTTLVIGGGIQVGITFVEFAFKSYLDKFEFLFVVSKQIYDTLSPSIQTEKNVIAFNVSPAAIFKGKETRKSIKKLERDFQPDLVYSIGFPSYIRFKSSEVGRYTNGWEINPPPLPWHTVELKRKPKIYLGIKYRLLWARNATFFETQTKAAKLGIIKKLGVGNDKVKVIPNSPNPIFTNIDEPFHFDQSQTIKIFCLSAAYKHKNLEIIPEVAHYLKTKYSIKTEFVLTLPKGNSILEFIESKAEDLDVEDSIVNVGKINLTTCLEWYKNTHIVFMPTLFEIFSATYVEAMAMRRPIIATDLEFATGVCGNAALYYKSNSAEAAADVIAQLILDKDLQSKLINNGIERLAYYPNPDEKYKISFDWLEKLAQTSRDKNRI